MKAVRRLCATSGLIVAMLLAMPTPAHPQVRIVPMRTTAQVPPLPEEHVGPRRLHLSPLRQVPLPYRLSDGAGNEWEIHADPANRGSSTVAPGMRLLVQGPGPQMTAFAAVTAWSGEDEREIQLADLPSTTNSAARGGVIVYRRIRVYQDLPVMRWMDILHNSTQDEMTVSVRIQSPLVNIASTATDRGRTTGASEANWVAAMPPDGGGGGMLYLLSEDGATARPQVQIQRTSAMTIVYNVRLAAGQTGILCYFQARLQPGQEAADMLGQLNTRLLLDDLGPSTRRLILNLGGSGYGGILLNRHGRADRVQLINGDPIHGRIVNESLLVGPQDEPRSVGTARLVGMARSEEAQSLMAVFRDGQIHTVAAADQVLRLELNDSGVLEIPLDRVAEWSFAIDNDDDDGAALTVPAVMLRSGEIWAIDAAASPLPYVALGASIRLDPHDVHELELSDSRSDPDRLRLHNGTLLTGRLPGQRVSLTLLGADAPIELPREQVHRIVYSPGLRDDHSTTEVSLVDGRTLYGHLLDVELTVETSQGAVSVPASEVSQLQFIERHDERVVHLTRRDGGRLEGRLQPLAVPLLMGRGTRIDLDSDMVNALTHSGQHTPRSPEAVAPVVAALVEKFLDADYRVRDEASEALLNMGRQIAPLLEAHYEQTRDPETRHRLRDVLDRLSWW